MRCVPLMATSRRVNRWGTLLRVDVGSVRRVCFHCFSLTERTHYCTIERICYWRPTNGVLSVCVGVASRWSATALTLGLESNDKQTNALRWFCGAEAILVVIWTRFISPVFILWLTSGQVALGRNCRNLSASRYVGMFCLSLSLFRSLLR